MSGVNWNEWLRGHTEEVLTEIGIQKGQIVLDFGCGSGLYIIPAARLVGEEGKVYALDKNEEALKEVLENAKKSGLRNVKTINSDTLKTGLDDESVDVVLLYDVIHLIEDRRTLFSEIRRILKPEGVVSIYPMHVKADEIKKQMRENGFSLKDEKYEGNILNFVNFKMQILDEIISSLTDDSPVREVRACIYWTAVISKNCSLRSPTTSSYGGLASTLRDECPEEHLKPARDVGKMTQKSAKELAQYVKSDILLEATIGMAALNSLINVDESKCVELNAFDVIAEKGVGKNIAVIGHFPFIPKLRKIAGELWVLEKRPRQGDLTEDMAPEVLEKSDIVAISATTLINHTLEKLLSYCRKDAFKIMLGPTTPMSDVMFDHGIDVISGAKVIDAEMVLRCISEGATFRQVEGVKLLSMARAKL